MAIIRAALALRRSSEDRGSGGAGLTAGGDGGDGGNAGIVLRRAGTGGRRHGLLVWAPAVTAAAAAQASPPVGTAGTAVTPGSFFGAPEPAGGATPIVLPMRESVNGCSGTKLVDALARGPSPLVSQLRGAGRHRCGCRPSCCQCVNPSTAAVARNWSTHWHVAPARWSANRTSAVCRWSGRRRGAAREGGFEAGSAHRAVARRGRFAVGVYHLLERRRYAVGQAAAAELLARAGSRLVAPTGRWRGGWWPCRRYIAGGALQGAHIRTTRGDPRLVPGVGHPRPGQQRRPLMVAMSAIHRRRRVARRPHPDHQGGSTFGPWSRTPPWPPLATLTTVGRRGRPSVPPAPPAPAVAASPSAPLSPARRLPPWPPLATLTTVGRRGRPSVPPAPPAPAVAASPNGTPRHDRLRLAQPCESTVAGCLLASGTGAATRGIYPGPGQTSMGHPDMTGCAWRSHASQLSPVACWPVAPELRPEVCPLTWYRQAEDRT